MPMKIATLGRERTLATLARRLYRIEGRGSADLQRRAEAALVAANSRLASAEGFHAGSPVVVPAVSGLTQTEEVKAAPVDDQGLTTETALRLQALGSRIDDIFNRAAGVRREALARLEDPEFTAEARKALPESAKLLDLAKNRLTQEEEEADAASKNFQQAVSGALESLQLLDKLARREGPT